MLRARFSSAVAARQGIVSTPGEWELKFMSDSLAVKQTRGTSFVARGVKGQLRAVLQFPYMGARWGKAQVSRSFDCPTHVRHQGRTWPVMCVTHQSSVSFLRLHFPLRRCAYDVRTRPRFATQAGPGSCCSGPSCTALCPRARHTSESYGSAAAVSPGRPCVTCIARADQSTH